MDDVRVGLFGLGHRGLGWLRLIQTIPGLRITAIGDLIPALHERGRAQLKDGTGVPAYTEYEDMLADPNVDAIALVVRAERQGAMAAQALEAGKHVNAEVPAAHTMEDCWRIVVAAERSGLVYQLAEQSRYAGMFTAWKDLVHQGALGKITYVEGEYVGYKGDHSTTRIGRPASCSPRRKASSAPMPGRRGCYVPPSTTCPTSSAPCS